MDFPLHCLGFALDPVTLALTALSAALAPRLWHMSFALIGLVAVSQALKVDYGLAACVIGASADALLFWAIFNAWRQRSRPSVTPKGDGVDALDVLEREP